MLTDQLDCAHGQTIRDLATIKPKKHSGGVFSTSLGVLLIASKVVNFYTRNFVTLLKSDEKLS